MTRRLWLRLLLAIAAGVGSLVTGMALGDPYWCSLATAVPFGLGWFGGAITTRNPLRR